MNLSPRESQVATMIGQGHVRSDIARQLGIGVRTVDKYIIGAARKKGVGAGGPMQRLMRYAILLEVEGWKEAAREAAAQTV